MMKYIVGFIIFLILLFVGFFLFVFLTGRFSSLPKTPVTIDSQKFSLFVAKTQKEKEIGLSDTKSIPDDGGMMFQFDTPGYYSFWMRDMDFPIDIIFVKDGKIVTIYKNVLPPTSKEQQLPVYTSQEPSNLVLEIKSGLSDKYNIEKGDTVVVESK